MSSHGQEDSARQRLRLTLVGPPPEGATVINTADDFPAGEPVIKGDGSGPNLDMTCGSCDRVLIRGLFVHQLQGDGYLQCPGCRSYNGILGGT